MKTLFPTSTKMFRYFSLLLVSLAVCSAASNAAPKKDDIVIKDGEGLIVIETERGEGDDYHNLHEKKEDAPGAFVPINNDNDDYDFFEPGVASRLEKLDFEDTDGVVGENDLVQVQLEKLAVKDFPEGGKYVLDFISNDPDPDKPDVIRVWKDETKSEGSAVQSGSTEFDPAVDNTVYVEGITDGEDVLKLSMKSPGGKREWDTVTFNTYRIVGPRYVPDVTKYQYRAYVRKDVEGELFGWEVVGGSSEDIYEEDEDGRHIVEGRKFITWDKGDNVGHIKYSPAKGFLCDREVYVVEVALDFDDEDTFVVRDTTTASQVQLRAIKSANAVAFNGQIVVESVTGPIVRGKERGRRFMQIGSVQYIKNEKWYGRFPLPANNNPNLQYIPIRYSTMEGGRYLDGLTHNTPIAGGVIKSFIQSRKPWVGAEYLPKTIDREERDIPMTTSVSGNGQDFDFYRLMEDFIPANQQDVPGSFVVEAADTPQLAVVDAMSIAFAAEGNMNLICKRFDMKFDFESYIAVGTVCGLFEPASDSALYDSNDSMKDSYYNEHQRARVEWSFDASGDVVNGHWNSDDSTKVVSIKSDEGEAPAWKPVEGAEWIPAPNIGAIYFNDVMKGIPPINWMEGRINNQ